MTYVSETYSSDFMGSFVSRPSSLGLKKASCGPENGLLTVHNSPSLLKEALDGGNKWSPDDTEAVTPNIASEDVEMSSASVTVADPETGYPPLPASTRLRRLIHDSERIIVCPGVYDGFSARIAMEVGFDGLYMVRTKLLVEN